jgi:alkylglycerol monooxygenase
MQPNLIILAIPVFILLIGLELVVTRLQEKDYYRLSDSINDLSCGMVQQLLEVFAKTGLFAAYVYLWTHARAFDIPGSAPWAWVAGFIGVDFLYYWFHRLSHEVNAFWAAHVVHHQSEDYNLAVALRQGAFQSSFSWVFYLPLALLGFPPLLFLTLTSIDTLYQFWIHTRAIGTLGPLEWVLNTPSHHRVHHGRNPRYIDRNHAGTFIVWDRMFGTFQQEDEEAVYGITTPLASWNPMWANLHYWVELVGKARRTARWSDRVRLFLKPPGWHPEDLGGFMHAPEVDHATYRKWDSAAPLGLRLYAFAQFVIVLGATSALLFLGEQWPLATRLLGAAGTVVSLVVVGGLMDTRAWAFALETLRQLATLASALVLGGSGTLRWPYALALGVVALVSLPLLARVRPARPDAPAAHASAA